MWVDGAGNFVRDELSDDQGVSGVDQGVGVFQFRSLPAGAQKSITLGLTAKSAGNSTITLESWGATTNNGPPTGGQSVSCAVAVNP